MSNIFIDFVGIFPKLIYKIIKEILSRFFRFCSDIGLQFLDFIDSMKCYTIIAILKVIEEVDGNDK